MSMPEGIFIRTAIKNAIAAPTHRLLQLLLILLREPAGGQLRVQVAAAHCHVSKAGPLHSRPLGRLLRDPVEPAKKEIMILRQGTLNKNERQSCSERQEEDFRNHQSMGYFDKG